MGRRPDQPYYDDGRNFDNGSLSDEYTPDTTPSKSNSFAEWLYADDWSEEKLAQFEFYYSIPLFKNYIDYLLDSRADSEYMRRYQIDWSDIHDPRKLRQVSSGSRTMSYTLSFVSDNFKRLYR